MPDRRALRILTLGLLFAAGPAAALEFRSVAEATVMYDGPSQKANPLFAVIRGTPVEVVVTLEPWVKVRDAAGDITWVDRRVLSPKRTLLVTAPRAEIRAQPESASALVFEAEKDVLLDLVEPAAGGWVKVRHRDGQGGFVRANQVWGL